MRMRAALVTALAVLAWPAGPALSDPSPNILMSPTGSAAEPPASTRPADAATAGSDASAPPQAQPSDNASPKVPAQAQAQAAPAPGAEDGGRYSFHRVNDSFIRLDTRTGQLSQCGWGANGWSCKLAPDERTALESEIARLQGENAALKKTLLARGIVPPGTAVATAPEAEARPVPPADVPDPSAKESKAPPEVNLDRAVGYVKGLWRRLVEMVADLQRDLQKKS